MWSRAYEEVGEQKLNEIDKGSLRARPQRRGMTRVPDLMAAGVNVAFGHDCVMDPWYGMASGDMLEVTHMAYTWRKSFGTDAGSGGEVGATKVVVFDPLYGFRVAYQVRWPFLAR